MLLIDPNNNYPRYIGDVYISNPDFDGVNLPDGWKVVEEVEAPLHNSTKIAVEQFPVLINNKYKQSWTILDNPNTPAVTLPSLINLPSYMGN